MAYDKKKAKEIIKRFLNNTGWVNHEITAADMYNMLVWRMQFGNAEAQCIIAALTLAGAEWKEN